LLFNRFFHLGTWGLCVLSLPISATLQFFLGFPLRLLSSQLSGVFLRLSGFDVEVAGGVIKFGEKLISVDAPCSGVKMLTVTALLVCLISVYKKLTNWQTTLLSLFALVILIFANSVRAIWLFFTESGIALYDYKDVIHDTSGVIIFILIVSTLLLFHKFFLNKEHMKIEKETVTSAKTFSITIFIFSCLITLFANPQEIEQQDISIAVEFPATWDGKKLQELPMTAKELSFLKRFPGKIAKFRDKENNSYIFRIVTEKTRRLHSASDCFKGLGYRITYKPLVKDKFGVWQSFEAEKGGERKLVKEIIIDEAGRSWSDVSKWYWSASTSKYWNNVVIVSPL
jgi:exosortase/archaeosortase family protein